MAAYQHRRCISLTLLAFLTLSAFLGGSVLAKDLPALVTPQTLEQANAQRERAAAMKQAAEDQLITDKRDCYQKILVSGCIVDAEARHKAAVIEARNLDIPARAFQRDAKRADLDAKEAQREADQPKREAEMKDQAANFRSDEARRAAERERKIAERAEQSAQYREKAAADAKAREERQAQREKKDAERAANKAQQEAQAEADARSRVPK